MVHQPQQLRHHTQICPPKKTLNHANSQRFLRCQSCLFHKCTVVYQESIFNTNVCILDLNPAGSPFLDDFASCVNTAGTPGNNIYERKNPSSRGWEVASWSPVNRPDAHDFLLRRTCQQADVEPLQCMCESSFSKQIESSVRFPHGTADLFQRFQSKL